MSPVVLDRNFLAKELICDEHNLAEALALNKQAFTRALAKSMRQQMRFHGFRYGMPDRKRHGA